MYQFEKPAKDSEVIVMETSKGTIKLRLFPDKAPKTVENFVTHAKEGYYDGLTFHRVINGFMIQGGDPEGTAKASGADRLRMSSMLSCATSAALSRWQMPVLAPTAASSSLYRQMTATRVCFPR